MWLVFFCDGLVFLSLIFLYESIIIIKSNDEVKKEKK